MPAHERQHEAQCALAQVAEDLHEQVDRQRRDGGLARRGLAAVVQVRALARAARAASARQLAAAAQADVAPPAFAGVPIWRNAARWYV